MATRLSMEAYAQLDLAGEKAAFLAGIAPEGAEPRPEWLKSPTSDMDVLEVMTSRFLAALPEGSRLYESVEAALDDAVELVLADEDELDEGEQFSTQFESNGKTAAIVSQNEDSSKELHLILADEENILSLEFKMVTRRHNGNGYDGIPAAIAGALERMGMKVYAQ